jgi:hypothetical protein
MRTKRKNPFSFLRIPSGEDMDVMKSYGVQWEVAKLTGSVLIYTQLVIISCLQYNNGVVIADWGLMTKAVPSLGGLVPNVGLSPDTVLFIYCVISVLIVIDLLVAAKSLYNLKVIAERMLRDVRAEQ